MTHKHDPSARQPSSFDPPPGEPPATLAAALRNAAGDLQQAMPPPDLQARVLAAARAAAVVSPATADHRRRLSGARPRPAAAPAPAHRGAWAWSGAAVCAVVLAGSALLMLRVPPTGGVDDGLRVGAVGGAAFLPLVPADRWPADAAPAWLVSTELPSERLAALGLPFDPARAGDRVRAELLLHPSGEVLAVRVLH